MSAGASKDIHHSNFVIASSPKSFLPAGYTPCNYDVIIGRKKHWQRHPGNLRLRLMVSVKLNEYSAAQTRTEKSKILMTVVKDVRACTPKGGFIQLDSSSGLWSDVGDVLAREKVSQTFRDAFQDKYKSSNAYKRKQRREDQTLKTVQNNMDTSNAKCKVTLDNTISQIEPNQPFRTLERTTISSTCDCYDIFKRTSIFPLICSATISAKPSFHPITAKELGNKLSHVEGGLDVAETPNYSSSPAMSTCKSANAINECTIIDGSEELLFQQRKSVAAKTA